MVLMFCQAAEQSAVWQGMDIIDIFLNYKKFVRKDLIMRYSSILPFMESNDRQDLLDHIDSLHPFANKNRSNRSNVRRQVADAADEYAREHPDEVIA